MKKIWCFAVKAALSGLISLLLLSGFSLLYDNTPIGIEQPSGITNFRFEPDSRWSYMKEGFAWGRTNNIGYNNPYDLQEDGEALVAFLGSSHSEALEVMPEHSFVSLVQSRLLEDANESNNYQCINFGVSSHFLNVTISNFDVITKAFDNIACIVIEAENLAYSERELQKMLDGEYSTPLSPKSLPEKILQRIPYVRSLKRHIEALTMQANRESVQDYPLFDTDTYVQKLDQVLEKVASLAAFKQIPVVIVYHSPFELKDQEGLVRTDCRELSDLFKEICRRHSISFIDVSDACINHYRATYKTPAGFSNTFMGYGHLNETGHKIIADAVYQEICSITGEANGF